MPGLAERAGRVGVSGARGGVIASSRRASWCLRGGFGARGPEVHCRIRKASFCTAVASRKCIAESRKQACALQARVGSALQNPESKLVHCRREPKVHCRIQKASLCTAVAGRKSIAESRKQACALQSRVFVPVDTTKSPCPQSGIHETAPPRGCLSPVQLFSHAYIITAGDSSAILYKCGGPIESQS